MPLTKVGELIFVYFWLSDLWELSRTDCGMRPVGSNSFSFDFSRMLNLSSDFTTTSSDILSFFVLQFFSLLIQNRYLRSLLLDEAKIATNIYVGVQSGKGDGWIIFGTLFLEYSHFIVFDLTNIQQSFRVCDVAL